MERVLPYIQCNTYSTKMQYKKTEIYIRNIYFCVLPVLSCFCGESHGKSTHDRVLSIRDSYCVPEQSAEVAPDPYPSLLGVT